MNRTTLALLIAPMWIPVSIEFYMTREHSFGDAWIISVIYGFFGYLVSLSFDGSTVDFLRARVAPLPPVLPVATAPGPGRRKRT
ncbi:MAG: hypothetical protein R3E65_07965 [Steroidobacteraceae bacterium]